MAYPIGFKKNIKITNHKEGPEKRQEFLDDIDYKGTYLPKGVGYEDIDNTFINFVNEDLSLVIGGENVPVIFLTIQKWTEFSKTWSFTDKFKNIKMPFITIVRKPDVQVGTNQVGLWNIPGNKLYTYIKIPTFNNGRKGIDTYKIPQPSSVDITYEVRLFCNRMKDLNKLQELVQTTFNSRQFYIYVNGHPMPIHLEVIGDESQFDFDKRRFYVQNFEMKVLGYILNENDFEVIPMVNRVGLKFTEIQPTTSNITNRCYAKYSLTDNALDYSIVFEPYTDVSLNLLMSYDINFINQTALINLNSINYMVNGDAVILPFSVNSGDVLNITVDKLNGDLGSFHLNGVLR